MTVCFLFAGEEHPPSSPTLPSQAVFRLLFLPHERSTEVYFADVFNIEKQLEWMEQDLILANAPENRTERPWIIAYGHR